MTSMMMSSNSQPRGLHNFISDIRNAPSKEEERCRVDKELANIRAKFATSANLSSYQKKKYVWKMCYIYMLGYDVDFGHLECISLLSSTKFQEKSVGYMACALLLKPGDELMTLVVNSIRSDLVGNLNHGQTLALAAISNIGGSDLAEALCPEVQRLIIQPLEQNSYQSHGQFGETEMRTKALICKKAVLCLLRLFRTNPDCLQLSDWMPRIAKLLENRDFGVITSTMSLLLGFASHSTPVFEPVVPYVISILTRLVVDRTCAQDYLYYRTPSPWLQVKCLRFLQYYKCPEDSQGTLLNEVLDKILAKTEVSDNVNKSNGDHSVLFEAVNLIVSFGIDAKQELKVLVQSILGRFIALKDPNIRYLGLDCMTKLARLEGPSAVQDHLTTVLDSLKDTDISVRKRALGLLFVMTDTSNSNHIVGELVTNLSTAETAMKDEMVVKIAILAEKHSTDLKWYINTMCQVILVAGDYVAEAVWYRIVQIVVGNPEVHEYAAEKMMESVQNKFAHEISVSLGGYLLGEVGVNICERPGMSGYDQFAALYQHFPRCNVKVQSLLLTTFAKLVNLYPDTRDIIHDVFNKYSTSSHLEIQQRACEYRMLPSINAEVMETVLGTMPAYAADKANMLMSIMESNVENSDRSAWSVDKKEKDASRAQAQVTTQQSQQTQAQAASTFSAADSAARAIAMAGGRGAGAVSVAAPVKQMDLLSLDDDMSGAAAVGLSNDVQAKLKPWLSAALMTASGQRGTLFDDDILRIASQAEYRMHSGRMTIFFYNKTGADLVNFKATVEAVDGLGVKQQDAAVRITAGDEARMMLAIECLKPFLDPPSLDISFSIGQAPYKFTLKVPVTVTAFFEALPVDKPTYMTRWKSIEGDGLECQEVFVSARPVDANLLNALRNTLVGAIHLGIAAGLDSEWTITGCSSLRTGSVGPDGNPVAVGVMMRLEADAGNNRFRLTVRAKHPSLANALKNTIKIHLAAN